MTARASDPVDPTAIDTTSANVKDVRAMWQQAAQVSPATEVCALSCYRMCSLTKEGVL